MGVRQGPERAGEDPAIVVASHRQDARRGELGAAAIEITGAVRQVAHAGDPIDAGRGEVSERSLEVDILGVDVPENTEAA